MNELHTVLRHLIVALSCCATTLATHHARARAAESKVDYDQDIRPLLANRCFRCHGPDTNSLKAGLRLDVRENAVGKRDGGEAAIAPGKPDESTLIARITSSDDDFRMPPPSTGEPLSQREKQLLTRWIQAGAAYERHWSFVAPRAAHPPDVSDPTWVRSAVDCFVLARLDAAGLSPSPEADRYALARRASLDVTGLPPSIDEVDRFVADTSEWAYEKYVDRLLQSPAYGERWARVWLDLARYADSAGYAQDPPRSIWKYRDWVIDAINEDKSFDQFTIEQFAGDLLPDATTDQLIATAFHRNTMTNSEGGTDDEEFRNAAIVDRVNTTMQVWMGLTMGCAQCHNHKYDPISQEEYFRVFAILNNTEDADRGDESPVLELFSDEQQLHKERVAAEIVQLESSKASPERLAQLKKESASIHGVTTPIFRELPSENRRKTHIQVRGNFLVKDKEVTPGVPAAFHPLHSTAAEPSRLDLARWLVDERNPLTARVVVNRYWEHLFGTGLVPTSEDFGTQGQRPSHPRLLDYLARQLMLNGWDTKWLVRTITTSATYRQSSRVTPVLLQRDPENRLLARGPRFRLPAEMIRDQALFVSGLLSDKMHGPSVQPPRPVLGLRAAFGASTDWQTSAGDDKYRRGLYTSWRRTTPYPSMTAFDAPSREVCTIRRVRTNTPLQALVTLNDPVYVEASQALARRIVSEGGQSEDDRIVHGFRLCLSRPPTLQEQRRIADLFHEARGRFEQSPNRARPMATEPLGPARDGSNLSELAAWTVVSNVLMNLDEFLARR